MTLHPRFQPPTLEVAPRRGHSFILALALTVFAAGFAYAMPRTMLTTAEGDTGNTTLTPTGSTHTETATTPTPDPTSTDTGEETGDEGEGEVTEHPENHGAAVSTAAHCDLDGRAHGEFVRSIAHDKDATVAEVEAACAAAMADAAAGSTEDARAGGRGHSKAPKPPKAESGDDNAAAGSTAKGPNKAAGGSAPDDGDQADTGAGSKPAGTGPADNASGDDTSGDDVDHGSSGNGNKNKP